jgi:hypothetical protein
MKAEKSKYKIFVPKNPRLNFAFEEVQTVYFRGYIDFYDGDDYIVNRNTRKEGYLVSYAYEYWGFGYEEPDFGEGDIVSVHFESTKHPYLALQMIRERGAKAFLAINPGTAASVILPMLSVMDGVLVMTVNPGFAGQKLAESTLAKITEVRELAAKAGRDDLLIETDGNVSFENAVRMSRAGADIFVAGTSAVFRKDMTLEEGLKKLQDCVENA